MKKVSISYVASIALVALTVFQVYDSWSFSGGITGRTRKGGNPGCTCHSGTPTDTVLVRIVGPDTVQTGQRVDYTLTINNGPLVAAGTNIAVQRGTLDTINGQGLRPAASELTHISPKAPSNNQVRFQFRYTAPGTTGLDSIYANGNSVNLSGSNSGDAWNFAPQKIVRVVSRASVSNPTEKPGVSFELAQNYPNPFNPSTGIRYQVPSVSDVQLEVFDMLGRKVATLVNERKSVGSHFVSFNASNLASGVYLYKLTAGTFSETKKMLLVK
jgi:hypothetical protein